MVESVSLERGPTLRTGEKESIKEFRGTSGLKALYFPR